MLRYLPRILSHVFLPSQVIKLHMSPRIPSQISWYWAIAEVNPLSTFLAPGYSRHESLHSFPGTGLQQRQIPCQLSWHWATAEANPLSAFPALGYIRCESPLSFPATAYSRGDSPLSFLRTGLLQRRIPCQLSWHWATAEANTLSAFLTLGYSIGAYPLSSLGTGSRGESPLSFPDTGLQ